MTNTREGMTLERSILGKHIVGCMSALCLETWIQIKVKATVPPGAPALERRKGLVNTSLFVIFIEGYPKTNLLRQRSK